eukprot:scaffold6111_cov107-Isochrysis_galbana.AAC.3
MDIPPAQGRRCKTHPLCVSPLQTLGGAGAQRTPMKRKPASPMANVTPENTGSCQRITFFALPAINSANSFDSFAILADAVARPAPRWTPNPE